jgi:peptidoglycan/xylan/chitin deacetylase (PgdA/CDA1 family)
VKGSFFLTGRFYRNKDFKDLIESLSKEGHYLGAHSDQHLLYCAWEKRDSLLINKQTFTTDLLNNYREMEKFGVKRSSATLFLPPYEWYNDTISTWTRELGLQLINFSPGTRSTADYTWPGLNNYRSSDEIYESISNFEIAQPKGLNGYILLIHIGTDARRTDKFYHRLPQLIDFLKLKGYSFQRIDELLSKD